MLPYILRELNKRNIKVGITTAGISLIALKNTYPECLELLNDVDISFDSRNLYYFLNFYKTFPNILNTVCSKSETLLSWSHYRTLLQVLDKEAREWYEKEALGQTWSVRTLQRNISSQYYYRLLKSQVKEPVVEEMKKVNENQYLMNNIYQLKMNLEQKLKIKKQFLNYRGKIKKI